MEVKPLTPEAIALTEKKMNMTLDDIINMAKTNEIKGRKQRVWKRYPYSSNHSTQDRNAKVQRFMNSRSSMRQGALAQRRTNFQSNQFPLTNETAKKAAFSPMYNKAFNQRRPVNVNKLRVAPPPPLKKPANGGGFRRKQNFQHRAKPALGQEKPQTLDSLFANMKENRLKSLPQQNNVPRRNGGGHQSIVPWARRHFNY